MKTFWAVFFAILAAAAVIWGVASVSESRSKRWEADSKYAKEAVDEMRHIASAAEVGADLPDYIFTSVDVRFMLLKSAVQNQGSRLEFQKQTFIRDARDLIAALKNRGDHKEWVQKFTTELDAFERNQ